MGVDELVLDDSRSLRWWSRPTDGYESLVLDSDRVVAVCPNSVQCRRLEDGVLVWEDEFEESLSGDSEAVIDDAGRLRLNTPGVVPKFWNLSNGQRVRPSEPLPTQSHSARGIVGAVSLPVGCEFVGGELRVDGESVWQGGPYPPMVGRLGSFTIINDEALGLFVVTGQQSSLIREVRDPQFPESPVVVGGRHAGTMTPDGLLFVFSLGG